MATTHAERERVHGPAPWTRFSPVDEDRSADMLTRMVMARLDAEGVSFGSFAAKWIPIRPGDDRMQTVMLMRRDRKIHVGVAVQGDPDTIIDRILGAVVEHLERLDEIQAHAGTAWRSIEPLLAHIDARPVMTHGTGMIDVRPETTYGTGPVSRCGRGYIAHARLLDNGLQPVDVGIDANLYSGGRPHIVGSIASAQERRRARLASTGDRATALTCCPIAAAILSDPRHPRHRIHVRGLIKAAREGATTLVDGHYAPSIGLGQRIKWRDGVMTLPVGNMPATFMNSLDGQRLAAIVGHEWLPEGVIRSHRTTNSGLEIHVDYDAVPLKDALTHTGITIDDIS